MRGRFRKPAYCIHGHKFTPANTYVRKNGYRQCKACARHRAREWHRKERAQGRLTRVDPAWFREYRRRVQAGEHIPHTRVVRQHVTANVLDLLEIDSGWLTAPGIAEHLGCDPKSVERILFRLRQRGVVRSKVVGLAGRDSRMEWRAA